MSQASNSVEKQLIEGLRTAGVPENQPLILAVSGGADSMALLHAASRSLNRRLLTIAHLNHQLRGTDSEQDADFVRNQADLRGLACFVVSEDVSAFARDEGLTLEEAARLRRYRFLTHAAAESGSSWVVTAHHQQDQAETVLHHILRGTSVRGLAGMPNSRTLDQGVTLVRPLLAVGPQQIHAYLKESDIPFRDDVSNNDTEFTRNRIRHELLPLLSRVYNDQTQQHLVSLSQQAAEIVEYLDVVASEALMEAQLELQPHSCRLRMSVLQNLPVVILRQVLTLLWSQQEWPRRKMSYDHWQRLAQSIRQSLPLAQDLPGNLRVEIRGDLLHVFVRATPQ